MGDTTTPGVKPGWRTTEYWLNLAALLLTAGYASGLIPTSGLVATAFAIGGTVLGALGYTVARTFVKVRT